MLLELIQECLRVTAMHVVAESIVMQVHPCVRLVELEVMLLSAVPLV